MLPRPATGLTADGRRARRVVRLFVGWFRSGESRHKDRSLSLISDGGAEEVATALGVSRARARFARATLSRLMARARTPRRGARAERARMTARATERARCAIDPATVVTACHDVSWRVMVCHGAACDVLIDPAHAP